ncbi:MAG: isochorismate synthase MenF [Puniceicoccaceae bacterium]
MEIIDIPLENRADPEDLRSFLEACRAAAAEDGQDKIASICLKVKHIDPLAVLDSIYEGEAHHYYMENRFHGWALAGAEAVVARTWKGPDRFREARDFADNLTRNTIAIGDMSLPFSGPLFFGGFSFFDEMETDHASFPAAMLFVPQWQVAKDGKQYVAVANVLVGPDTDVGSIAGRIWSAHEKFTTFSYDKPPAPPVYHILEENEVGGENSFQGNVQKALGKIKDGAYRKIVLSRALDLVFDNPCNPLKILNRLRQDYPSCHCFSLQHESGTSFIGATPERLVSVQDGNFQTEAIAGSIARDADASEDARLASQLLSSEKDLREHELVVESIRKRLAELGVEASIESEPGLLVLSNVQHLHTPVTGKMPEGLHILDMAERLHPTPAVGGTPREAVVDDIAEWEPFSRGLFAGITGWFDTRGNGEFAVGIRSALAHGTSARLYAGAGIVNGSEPESEFRETSIKMEALLRCIRGGQGT